MEDNKTLILFNSPYLGGAERSMVAQMKLMDVHHLSALIPILNQNSDSAEKLIELIKTECPDVSILFFNYPKPLFSVSRSGEKGSPFYVLISLFKVFFELKKVKLGSYKTLWANGNKIGLISFLYCCFTFFSGKFVWHFRDYPSETGLFSHVFKVFKLPKAFQTILIGNSYSVCESLKKIAGNKDFVMPFYNPVGSFHPNKNVRENLNIGIVSMFAPWKGLHQIIHFSHKYAYLQ